MREIINGLTDLRGITTNLLADGLWLVAGFIIYKGIRLLSTLLKSIAAFDRDTRNQTAKFSEISTQQIGATIASPLAPAILVGWLLRARRWERLCYNCRRQSFRMAVMAILFFIAPWPIWLSIRCSFIALGSVGFCLFEWFSSMSDANLEGLESLITRAIDQGLVNGGFIKEADTKLLTPESPKKAADAEG